MDVAAATSALMEVLSEKLASVTIEQFGRLSGVRRDLDKLKSTLTAIQAVILDAEEKAVEDKAVLHWVAKLRDAAYDADDLLEEVQTEFERRKAEVQQAENLAKLKRTLSAIEAVIEDAKRPVNDDLVAKLRDAAGVLLDEFLTEGLFSSDKASISEAFVSYFTNLFNSSRPHTSHFPSLCFKKILTEEGAAWLTREVTQEEIKAAVFALHPDKAPGPDGLSAAFFQNHWNVIKEDLIEAILEFFRNKRWCSEINHTFICLVPKKRGASKPVDYRPISCCNTIYKIVSKILALRLQGVINSIISQNQVAFIKGRLLSDANLLASEMVRGFNKKTCLNKSCLKLDITKTFDSLNREFLWHCLNNLGFPDTWINWIKICISGASFSILLNGSSAGFFLSNRGLRQGDPLSPLLFTIVMEALTLLIEQAVINGEIIPFSTSTGFPISHLIFADDVLLFSKASVISMTGIRHTLQLFATWSGLEVNLCKSQIFFSKGTRHREALLSIIGIPVGSLPFKYLGLPLSDIKIKHTHCSTLLDTIKGKVANWKASTLSLAGRLELIRSVLYGHIYHWIGTLELPKRTYKEIQRTLTSFLWHSPSHPISWEKISRPKKEGGLGLRKLPDMAKACVMKRFWRMITNGNSIWGTWLRNKLVGNSNIWSKEIKAKSNPIWKQILEARDLCRSHIAYLIGNGLNISFWQDPWLPEGRLIDILGEELYQRIGHHKASIASFLQGTSWNLPRVSSHLARSTWTKIQQLKIPEPGGTDSIIWKDNPSGDFTIRSAWNLIRTHYPDHPGWKVIWAATSPPRIKCCLYKASLHKLRTKDVIQSWGITLDPLCVLCKSQNETGPHLFLECSFSTHVWSCCRMKMGLPQLPSYNLQDEMSIISSTFQVSSGLRNLACLALGATIWYIWNERNNIIFNKAASSSFEVVKKIQTMVKSRLGPIQLSMAQNIKGKAICDRWELPTAVSNLPSYWKPTEMPTDWMPPPLGKYKLNLCIYKNCSGQNWGCLIRDSQGDAVWVACSVTPLKSPLEAACQAVNAGLEATISHLVDSFQLCCETSNVQIASILNIKHPWPWMDYYIKSEWISTLDRIDHRSIGIISGRANRPAYRLAKCGVNGCRGNWTRDQFDNCNDSHLKAMLHSELDKLL